MLEKQTLFQHLFTVCLHCPMLIFKAVSQSQSYLAVWKGLRQLVGCYHCHPAINQLTFLIGGYYDSFTDTGYLCASNVSCNFSLPAIISLFIQVRTEFTEKTLIPSLFGSYGLIAICFVYNKEIYSNTSKWKISNIQAICMIIFRREGWIFFWNRLWPWH